MPRTRSGGGYSMPGKNNKKALGGQNDSDEKQQNQDQAEQSDDTSLLDQLDRQQHERDDDEVESLIKERDDIISRLKRIHFYATRKMFKQIDQSSMDIMVDRLYDLQQQLGVHDEFEAIFDQITEVNSILLEREDREKSMNLSRHSSKESLASSSHSPPIIVMNAANDPNLVVDPWDGTATGYYKFERRFVSTYVQNDAYSPANRFAAYARLVGPKGREIIDDLEQTPDGLNTAMERMQERFAHKEQVRADVERKLVNIPFVKSQFDAQGFGAIISATESSLRVLKQADIEDSYIDRVVFGTVGSKIPRPILDRFLRKNDYAEDTDKLISYLRNIVEGLHKSERIVSTALNVAASSKARINAIESSPNPKKAGPKSPRSPHAGPLINHSQHQPKNNRSGRPANQQSSMTCRLCEGDHHSFFCSEGTVDSRKRLAVSKQFCFRCLLRHPGAPCRSSYICPCGGTHTRVLCSSGGVRAPPQSAANNNSNRSPSGSGMPPSSQQSNSPPSQDQNAQTQPKSGITMSIPKADAKPSSTGGSSHLKYSRPDLLTTYYETVVVKINNEMVRVQLDSGAGRTLILQELADRLKLRHYSKHNLKLGGFDGLSSQSSERLVTAQLKSIKTHHSFKMIMCVTPRIDHRPRSVSSQLWNALQSEGYELSDSPEYDQLPISIVVGAEYYRLLFRGNYVSYNDDLSLRPSIFGWVLTGTTEDDRSITRRHNSPFVGLINSASQSENEAFLQSVDANSLLTLPLPADAKLALANTDALFPTNSANDSKLEEEFNQEFMDKKVRLRDRRYSVKLEWIDPIEMGNNKQVALIRHHRLERSLEARDLTLAYTKELGEMVNAFTEPAEEQCTSKRCYYMPHHPVVRLDKDTTKLRVVFDASSHATGTKSLNDNLYKGVVKWDLLDVLLRFRFGQYAVIADIEKAFLQIQVDPEDRDAFRFWWKDDTGQLSIRRFKVVPFGTSISPYLLFIVFSHLFSQMQEKYPEVVPVIKDRMYVDDVIIAFQGATPEDLDKFRTMSVELFQEASMNLRKFRTNHQQLDEQWAGPDRAPTAKVLGHAWTVLADSFAPSIDIGPYLPLASFTKREFTAFVQSVYNPTGIVAPYNLKLKLALRELWALKLRWDEPVPESNLKEALELISDAKLVNSMVAPRNVLPDDGSTPSLRIYADASEKAVAVVAYCCSTKGNFHLFAKTRLARSATMPELELDALGMAAAVAHHLSFVHPFSRVVICGDSKCNLQRLQQHPNKQKPSIALRIRKISKLAPTATFRHVTTKENLADVASRGSTMAHLVTSKQWLEAPELPASTQFEHTISSQMMTVSAVPADDQCACTRYATYKLAVGTYRFVARLLTRKTAKYADLPELELALILLIREVQRNHFRNDIISVDESDNILFDKQSVLQNLGAHMDQYGLVRLRTRIEQTVNFSYEEVHPVILPPHCHFSRLVIANTHHQLFHPGVERTCSSIRERYFIINQRRMVKHFVNKCQICRRKRHSTSDIRHGPVPPFRYDVSSPPFTNTGIDLFGPVKVPMENDAKAYGVIYVCATSRLVYIDAIPDMTAESVFQSVTHFVARNGLPGMFYSDNGKQLIKVKSDLQKYLEEMSLKRPDQEYRVKWQHLTAHSPWKGGFYERLNRSIKEALSTFSLDRSVSTHSIAGRVNGKKSKLSLDQLKHVFAEIESMINNRPLFEYEGKVIRPIDFKAGQGSLQMPIACNLPARYQKPNIIRDYKAFQTKVNHFRRLWKTSYILELRSFHQHTEKQKVPRQFEVGDVVHVKAPSTRLDQWPLGIVTQVFRSSDGISRSVKVRTLSRGNVVEENKDVRNLIPTEANQERHEYSEPEETPVPDPVPEDHQILDLPDPRLRATASRISRLRPTPAKKESLDKLAKKWSRALQLKQKDAVYRQRLRDLISSALAKGTPRDDPQVKDWLQELYSISTDTHCRALP